MADDNVPSGLAIDDAALLTAIHDFVETWMQREIRHFVEVFKLCDEGRLKQAKLNFLKQLVSRKLCDLVKQEEATTEYYQVLPCYTGVIRFLQSLDLSLVKTLYPHLVVLYGKEVVYLAFRLSANQEQRLWAQQQTIQVVNEYPSVENAKAEILARFQPISQLQGEAPLSSGRYQDQLKKVHEERALQEKKFKSDLQSLRTENEKQRTMLNETIATLQFSCDELKKQLALAQAAVEREKKLHDLRATELLAARQISLFQGWLKPHIEREDEAQKSIDDVIAYATEAIEKQHRYDRASATVATLQEKLKACQEKHDEIQCLLCCANAKHPQILEAKAALEKEIHRLSEQLPALPSSPFAAAITDRLNVVKDEELPLFFSWLEATKRLNVLSKEEYQRLFKQYSRRIAIWESTEMESGDPLEIDPETRAIEQRNAELCSALRGQSPLMLFLDGHNVLNGLGRYRQRRGQPRSHGRNRHLLERDLCLLLRNLPNVFAHLVWDGATMSDSSLSDNVECHYSGGGNAEHRADDYILGQLKYYRDEVDMPLVLVTDDNDFAGAATRLGVKICKLHDFEAFLTFPHHD